MNNAREPIAEPWDARFLASIQGGAVEHPERREDSPWWNLIHLPFAVAALLSDHSGNEVFIVVVWGIATVTTIGAMIRKRRARRSASAAGSAFGR